MNRALPLLLVLVLAACNRGGSTAEDRCAAQAYDDPAVREAQAKAAGSPSWGWENDDRIAALRQQALARCLQGQGAIHHGGGVEAPR